MIRSLIAALATESRAIGIDGGLPWHLPDDLARFRRLTMGHTVIHGRRTHESLKGRHLDGRRIIILSGSLEAVPDNAQALAPGLAEAYRIAAEEFDDTETFVAGGGRVYRHALERELIDRMYLTLVEADVQGDTFFPPYDPSRWEVVHSEHHDQDERHAYPFVFQTLERRPLDEEAE